MKVSRLIAIAIFLLESGCQAMIYGTASGLDKISVGMTKEQVMDVAGSPTATMFDANKREEYLIYKKMKHAISMSPRTYQVTLRDGKVVKFGEQYEEKNVNEF